MRGRAAAPLAHPYRPHPAPESLQRIRPIRRRGSRRGREPLHRPRPVATAPAGGPVTVSWRAAPALFRRSGFFVLGLVGFAAAAAALFHLPPVAAATALAAATAFAVAVAVAVATTAASPVAVAEKLDDDRPQDEAADCGRQRHAPVLTHSTHPFSAVDTSMRPPADNVGPDGRPDRENRPAGLPADLRRALRRR